MNQADLLPAVLDRLAAATGEVALFSECELAEWPAAALARLKAEGLLVKGPPADTLTCPGCEEDCTMPVEIVTTTSGALRAFVVCDKRDDVARVAIARDLLEQWTCSPERVADVLARLLGTRRSSGDSTALRWDVGVLKGTQNSAHVVLGIERTLQLNIAGHCLLVADVLELGEKGLILERRALLRCVDAPVAAAGDALTRLSAACARHIAGQYPAPFAMRVMFNNAQRGANMTHTILRLPAVLRERARSRSAHYLDIQQGLFTHPVQIGLRAVGWPATEVATLNAARIAGKTEAEIRELVAKLEVARKEAA